MSESSNDVEIRLERDKGQFVAHLPDHDEPVGFISFRTQGSVMDLRHTEVEPVAEGRGVGSALVRAALETVREQGMQIIPSCPFVEAYLKRHPDQQDLLAER